MFGTLEWSRRDPMWFKINLTLFFKSHTFLTKGKIKLIFEDIYKMWYFRRMWWKWHQNWCSNTEMGVLSDKYLNHFTHTWSLWSLVGGVVLCCGIIIDSNTHSMINISVSRRMNPFPPKTVNFVPLSKCINPRLTNETCLTIRAVVATHLHPWIIATEVWWTWFWYQWIGIGLF